MAEQKSKLKTFANAKATADKQKSKVQVAGKKVVAKKVIAPKVSKTVAKKVVAAKKSITAEKKTIIAVKNESVKLSVSVYGLDGKVSGKINLPSEIFGEAVNKNLLAQAVRVYQANKRQGNASTKTRGEVDGSTRKIYRQKGTGNARHGSVRAPIFVKGGIVHGPKPRDFSLEMPKKMRRKALFSALSAKLIDGEIKILADLSKIEPKTKGFVSALQKLDSSKGKVLVVVPDSFENAKRAFGNLQNVSSSSGLRLNALEVIRNKQILISKESITEMEKKLLSNK